MAVLQNATPGDTVSIMSPNLDDNNFQDSVTQAVARGVRVRIIASYRFNDWLYDGGFFEVGHNNCIAVSNLYSGSGGNLATDIAPTGDLQIRWYVDEGANRIEGNGPFASHAKFMGVQDASEASTLVIVGSGNQDTASWDILHEYNVLIDGPASQALFTSAFTPAWTRARNAVPAASDCPEAANAG